MGFFDFVDCLCHDLGMGGDAIDGALLGGRPFLFLHKNLLKHGCNLAGMAASIAASARFLGLRTSGRLLLKTFDLFAARAVFDGACGDDLFAPVEPEFTTKVFKACFLDIQGFGQPLRKLD